MCDTIRGTFIPIILPRILSYLVSLLHKRPSQFHRHKLHLHPPHSSLQHSTILTSAVHNPHNSARTQFVAKYLSILSLLARRFVIRYSHPSSFAIAVLAFIATTILAYIGDLIVGNVRFIITCDTKIATSLREVNHNMSTLMPCFDLDMVLAVERVLVGIHLLYQ